MDSTIVDNFVFLCLVVWIRRWLVTIFPLEKDAKTFPGPFFSLFLFWVQPVIEIGFKNWYLVEWYNFLIRSALFHGNISSVSIFYF